MVTVQDGIAVITLDNPLVNALGHALRERIVLQIEVAQGGQSVRSRLAPGERRPARSTRAALCPSSIKFASRVAGPRFALRGLRPVA
jgi:hypothetical protein